MADVTGFENWSTTAASNSPSGSTAIGSGLDDNLREIQAQVKEWLASSDTIASAGTTDLATVGARFVSVTGTTTITALGTLAAGIEKVLIFSGALTLTHNATSLILPTAANITTVAGDVAFMVSLGSGNWRCTAYTRASGQQTAGNTTFGDGSVSAPSIAFSADTNTGIYRSTTDTLDITAGGANKATFGASVTKFTQTSSGTIELETVDGNITIDADGDSNTGTGSFVITANDMTATAQDDITLTAGKGGTVALAVTTSDALTDGGTITITSGAGGNSANGGDVTITGGAGGATNGIGGDIHLNGGAATGTRTIPERGCINLKPGSVGTDVGDSGAVLIRDASDDITYGIKSDSGLPCVPQSCASTPVHNSGGGTSPTIAGTAHAFQFTFGSTGTPATTLVLDWPANSPVEVEGGIGVCNYRNGGSIRAYIESITTNDITIKFVGGTPSNSSVLDVVIFGIDDDLD